MDEKRGQPGDSVLSFDFERILPPPTSDPLGKAEGGGNNGGVGGGGIINSVGAIDSGRSKRSRNDATDSSKRSKTIHLVVCRHWLRGMCIKGENCDFLHIFDNSRMPLCRSFRKHGRCAEYDLGICPLRHDHVNDEANDDGHQHPHSQQQNQMYADSRNHGISDGTVNQPSATQDVCIKYLCGYCNAGPACQQRHVKLPREKFPENVSFPDWYLALVVDHTGPLPPLDAQRRRESTLYWRQLLARLSGEQILESTEGTGIGEDAAEHDQSANAMEKRAAKTLEDLVPEKSLAPHGRSKSEVRPGELRIRCFVIKSGKIENILKSVQKGIWATGKGNIGKLEHAFNTCDHVLLLMSANESGGFQGYARMASLSDPNLYPKIWGSFSVKLSANFRLQWLKQCKLDFEALASYTNPLNENKPLKKSRDGQEMPIELAEAICLRLDALPEENLLLGTPLQELPRIDHTTFFSLTEEQKEQEEVRIGLRSLPPPITTGAARPHEIRPPPPPPNVLPTYFYPHHQHHHRHHTLPDL